VSSAGVCAPAYAPKTTSDASPPPNTLQESLPKKALASPERPSTDRNTRRGSLPHSSQAARVLKPYMGDIFGNYECCQGILYLSRFDQSRSLKKKAQPQKNTRPVRVL
jgi:hypothetical protein